MPRIKPRCIISDWDETITVKDTIQYVAQVPYQHRKVTPTFDYFTKVYLDHYNNYKTQFGPRSTLSQEIEFQTGMKQVEMSSIDKLQQTKIFQGLTVSQFEAQADLIQLRPGFIEFINLIKRLNIPFYILSVNWTSIIIRKVLQMNGISDIDIITNEFEFQNGLTTGRWEKSQIRDSTDKLNFVKKMGHNNIMYIGDSATDLLPLLHCKHPFIMKDGRINEINDKYNLQFTKGDWNDFKNYLNTY